VCETSLGKTSSHSKNVEQVTAGGPQLPQRLVQLESVVEVAWLIGVEDLERN